MTQATITSYTLLDFISEGDMDLFFSFIEEHMDEHAARLRENGMTKFYVTRIFNKGDKFTIANWLEYRDQEAFVACDRIWQDFMDDSRDKMQHIAKVVPHRGIVQYDFSLGNLPSSAAGRPVCRLRHQARHAPSGLHGDLVLDDIGDQLAVIDIESQRHPHVQRLLQDRERAGKMRQVVDIFPACPEEPVRSFGPLAPHSASGGDDLFGGIIYVII